MKLQALTPEEIRQENREYNARVWDEKIDRMMGYKNIQFYVARASENTGYSYDRYYATYTIPEGLNLMNEVSYSSSITNNGFTRVFIGENGEVTKRGFGDDGTQRVKNSKEGRKWLVDNICRHGVIVTNN